MYNDFLVVFFFFSKVMFLQQQNCLMMVKIILGKCLQYKCRILIDICSLFIFEFGGNTVFSGL